MNNCVVKGKWLTKVRCVRSWKEPWCVTQGILCPVCFRMYNMDLWKFRELKNPQIYGLLIIDMFQWLFFKEQSKQHGRNDHAVLLWKCEKAWFWNVTCLQVNMCTWSNKYTSQHRVSQNLLNYYPLVPLKHLDTADFATLFVRAAPEKTTLNEDDASTARIHHILGPNDVLLVDP